MSRWMACAAYPIGPVQTYSTGAAGGACSAGERYHSVLALIASP
jgi:hypothetical protein